MIRTLQTKESANVTPEQDTVASKSRTTLPRIQLPQFSGRYEDWPSFRDLFQSIISKDSSTTQMEKLHYLKTCLRGEAELLIRNLTTTEENYKSAWRILSAYYENKRLLTRAYLANFTSLTKGESAGELRKIFHGIKATVSSLAGIGRPLTEVRISSFISRSNSWIRDRVASGRTPLAIRPILPHMQRWSSSSNGACTP